MTSKSKTKKIVAGILGVTFALALFVGAGVQTANAALSSSQVDAIISLLQSFGADASTISNVRVSLTGGTPSATTGGSTVSGYTFTRNLKQGDTGEDVRQLQIVLNSDSATKVSVSGAGSPGNETSSFGPATKAAVIKFQNKYASEVLTPVGLSAGTGFVGASSRAKLNAISGAVTTTTTTTTTTTGTTGTTVVTVPAGSGLTVTAAATQPSAQLAPLSAARIPFTKVTFTASSDGDVTVSGLVVERGGQSIDGIFDSILLLDEAGMQLGLAKNLNSQHQVTLTEPFTVKAGQSRTFTLAGNRTSTAASANAGMVAILSLVKVNTSATVNGSFPITGTAQTVNEGLTIGSVTMNRGSIDPGTSVTKEVGITGYTFSAIRITAGSAENIRLKSIRWNQTGSVSTVDLANLKTYVDGTAYDIAVSSDGKYYTSTFGTGIVIEKGFSKEISIKGDVVGGSGRTIDFDIAKRTDIDVNGELYGFGITPPLAGTAASADGAAFNNVDDYYYDAAQVTVSNGSINISISSSAAPAQNIAVNTSNQILGAFSADVKGEAITVGRLGFNVSLASESTADVDDLTNVSLVDENGSVVAGPVDGSATDSTTYATGNSDGGITFTDTVTFPIGMHTYTLKGKVGTDFPNNATIAASTTPSADFATVKGLTTGNTITPGPASAITTNTMTVKSGAFAISVSPIPIAQTVIAGSKEFEFARYVLNASQSGEDIRVTTIPLDYSTNGTATDLTNCQLYDGATSLTTGSNVKNPSAVASTTTFTFDGSGLIVSKGTAKTLSLKCNVSTAATAGKTYQWGLVATADNGSWTGATGLASAQTIGEAFTRSAGQAMTASAGGSLTIAIDDNSPAYKIVAAGTTGVELARIKFSATNENIDLRRIGLQLSKVASNTPTDLVNSTVTLYDATNPTVAIATAEFLNNEDTATSTQITGLTIPKDGAKVIIVKGNIAAVTASGPLTASGDLLAVDYDGDSEGLANGTYGVGVASGSNVTPEANDTASQGIRIMRTYPVVESIALSTSEKTLSAGTTADKPIYKFKVTASGGPGGATSGDSIALYKTTFNIGSSTLAATTSLYSLYAYTDANYSNTDTTFSATGLINGGQCFSGLQSTGAGRQEVEIYPDKTGCNQATTTYKIPVGQTRYFQLRATVAGVESGTTNIDSFTVRLAGDSAYSVNANTLMEKASGVDGDTNDDFLWSPISTTTSNAISDLDFTNGYQVTGLPDVGTTQESIQSN